MGVEYQITVEYANGEESGHLSFKYESSEVRNTLFNDISLLFSENTVSQEFLSEFGGIIIESYDYIEPVRSAMASFVPYEYYDYSILNKVLKILEEKSIKKSVNSK